ncbi:MAG: hypothetical protein R3324_11275, partial [Halobacteriales archaeon]|nr:hypothetical protein [Halobacteriales archaeon]
MLLRDGGLEFEAEIVGDATSTQVQVRFMLEDAPLGTYDLVVERVDGGEEAVLADAVTVEPAVPLSVEITERVPEAFRAGGTAELAFVFTNTGNTDVPYLEGQLQVPAALELEVSTSEGLQTRSDLIRRDLEAEGETVGETIDSLDVLGKEDLFVMPLIARDLAPGASVEAVLRTGTGAMRVVRYSAWAEVYTEDEFVAEILEDVADQRQRILDAPDSYLPEVVALASDAEQFRQDWLEGLVDIGLLSPGAEFTAATKWIPTATAKRAETPVGNVSTPGRPVGSVRTSDAGVPISGASTQHSWPPTDEEIEECRQRTGQEALYSPVTYCPSGFQEECLCFRNVPSACWIAPGKKKYIPPPDCSLVDQCEEKLRERRRRTRNSGTPTTARKCGCKPIKIPCDPNDIIGPDGYGDESWVSLTQTLPYTVRFENDPERATAPAQVVRITHPLDPDVDARSFRLGDFGFGDFTFSPPENVAHYRTRLDVTAELGLFVDVT